MNDATELDRLLSQWQAARARGQDLTPAELCPDRPDLRPELERRISALRQLAYLIEASPVGTPVAPSALTVEENVTPPSSVPLPHIPGYEVQGLLGRGGMGVVYRARQTSLDRTVALKVVLAGAHAEDAVRRRFRTEAETIARLRHPNIVQIYEVGEHEGLPYFSLEYCPGGSLDRRLKQGPLEVREAATLVETVARAVQAAHNRGVVHRDLKPANVLMTEDGTPKVADFGLARKVDRVSQTLTGDVLGTPGYMAPEQVDGPARNVGPASDVFALGALLYECLTGRPPFKGLTALETMLLTRSADPVPPRRLRPDVPPDLETICLKCLKKNSDRRYASAAEVASRLRLYLDGRPIPDRPWSWSERASRLIRRHPVAVALSLAVLLLTGLVMASYPLPSLPASPVVEDRDRERREAEALLGGGRPYEFGEDGPLPGPFRWPIGEPGLLTPRPADGGFSLQRLAPCLLELVADPGSDHYRFSAEVRHDEAAAGSLVGLYIGYRSLVRPDGRRRAACMVVVFPDRGSLAQAWGQPGGETAQFRTEACLIEEKAPQLRMASSLMFGKTYRPPAPFGLARPWRRLAVEVAPQGVRAQWEDEEGKTVLNLDVPVARWTSAFRERRIASRDLADIPTDFRPRAGLGLFVTNGEASYRRIKIEPITPALADAPAPNSERKAP